MTRVTNLKTQYNTAKFTIFFQNFFIKTLQALVGMLRDVNKIYLVTLIFSFSICILKTKIYDTHNLLLGISLSKGYSIMIDQENFQQRPKRTNCKQLMQMSQPFTNIYNKFFSNRPKSCPNTVLSLPSSKKE